MQRTTVKVKNRYPFSENIPDNGYVFVGIGRGSSKIAYKGTLGSNSTIYLAMQIDKK